LTDNHLHTILRHLAEANEEGSLLKTSAKAFESFFAQLYDTSINNHSTFSCFSPFGSQLSSPFIKISLKKATVAEIKTIEKNGSDNTNWKPLQFDYLGEPNRQIIDPVHLWPIFTGYQIVCRLSHLRVPICVIFPYIFITSYFCSPSIKTYSNQFDIFGIKH